MPMRSFVVLTLPGVEPVRAVDDLRAGEALLRASQALAAFTKAPVEPYAQFASEIA